LTTEKTTKFLNLTQQTLLKDILDYSKIYFPESSKDLDKQSSSGRMMLEQAVFVGDILSFYLEDRFKNSNFSTANDIKSIVNKAESFGYKFRGPIAASDYTNFYLEVPAITGSAGNYIPDMRYAGLVSDVQLQNTVGVIFEAEESIDFSTVNISSSLECVISKRNAAGVPTNFILKTKAKVVAGKTVTETFSIGSYQPFKKIELSNKNVLEILSVKDSAGENWYEVDYLVQDVIFEGTKNTNPNESSDVPYILKIKSAPRRFVKRNDPLTGKTSLIFGTGKAVDVGSSTVPDPSLIAIDLKGKLSFSDPFVDPQDLIQSRTLGLSPYNTTLTIKARVGGGLITNTAENSLTDIVGKTFQFNSAGLDTTLLNQTLSSFSTRNLSSIQGGRDAETIEELKQFVPAYFATQGRVGTKQDYIVRTLTMPSIFGNVFRCYAMNNFDKQGGVQLFVLAKNNLGQLALPNFSLKKNIKTYLSRFVRQNQGIDILAGKIINIGIEYTIVVEPGFNKNEIKSNTLQKIKDYFKIENWQLNQPILSEKIRCLITDTEGVISIADFKILNKSNIIDGNQYSETSYDIKGNTRNNIIFCSPDSMFEIKFPNVDIKVGAV
jgi:hypothetical protein